MSAFRRRSRRLLLIVTTTAAAALVAVPVTLGGSFAPWSTKAAETTGAAEPAKTAGVTAGVIEKVPGDDPVEEGVGDLVDQGRAGHGAPLR